MLPMKVAHRSSSPYQLQDVNGTIQSRTSFGSANLILQSQPVLAAQSVRNFQESIAYLHRQGND